MTFTAAYSNLHAVKKKCLLSVTARLVSIALAGGLAFISPFPFGGRNAGVAFAEIETANPYAIPEARAILNYFDSLPSRNALRVVSGQFIGHPAKVGQTTLVQSNYDRYVTNLYLSTGQLVALVGADYARLAEQNDPVDLSLTNDVLANHWNAGGLVTISWHARNPWTGGNSRDRTIGSPFSDLTTPGTEAYNAWMAQLTQVADALEALEHLGVVVLWRPLHESNGRGFWWGQRSFAEFEGLWTHMFNHFTYERKLDNLLWVYSAIAKTRSSIKYEETYYPGPNLADMVGIDAYMAELKIDRGYQRLVALGKPFWLTEFGPFSGSKVIHDYDYTRLINKIRERYPRTVAFQCWNSNWSMVEQQNARQLLEDPWVITAEDLTWRA